MRSFGSFFQIDWLRIAYHLIYHSIYWEDYHHLFYNYYRFYTCESPQICQFVPISVKVYVLCTKLIFVRNGAKAYVKNPRVFLREKSAKRVFMKSSSHSSTASGNVFFSHWANKLRFLIERHSKLKSEIKNNKFFFIQYCINSASSKQDFFINTHRIENLRQMFPDSVLLHFNYVICAA